MAIKVSLRQKSISKGRKTLYLDFYPPIQHPKTNKLTRREFLKLYVFEKPKTPSEKKQNEENLRLGEVIRQRRENSLNKPEIYSEFEKEQLRIKELGNLSFLEYFDKLSKKRLDSNRSNWNSTLKYLKDFSNDELKFANINEKYLEDFKEYLLTAKS